MQIRCTMRRSPDSFGSRIATLTSAQNRYDEAGDGYQKCEQLFFNGNVISYFLVFVCKAWVRALLSISLYGSDFPMIH